MGDEVTAARAADRLRGRDQVAVTGRDHVTVDNFSERAEETLSYMNFPREHWRSLRTNNMLERLMRELRRRTRVVGNKVGHASLPGHEALTRPAG